MTFGELQHLVSQFSFTGGLRMWQPRIWVERAEKSDDIILAVEFQVPPRDQPSIGPTHPLILRHMLPPMQVQYMDAEYAMKLLHHLLIDCINHEVDEGVLFAGTQVRDPHKRGWL